MITELHARTPGGDRAGNGKVRTSDCRRCVLWNSLHEASLPERTIRAICDRMWLNRARRHQILFAEGNRASYLYAVRSGRVKLARVEEDGREHVTAILESGDLFGFEAVFGSEYGAGAEAMADCELCLASGSELRELMGRVPEVAVDLARYLHHQLERSRRRQTYLTALGARAKLAGYLLHELLENGAAEAEELVVPRDLTLRELGGVLGLSPETVCRALKSLEATEAIEADASALRVRDLATLRRLACS
jgi:CRP/FNR family transcriptional regulator